MESETELVVQCARSFLVRAATCRLRTLLAQQVDWRAVERKAEENSVMSLVAYVLATRAGESLSPMHLARLKLRLRGAACRNLAAVQKWQDILLAFSNAGVPVISLKGPTLGLMAYQNLALREFLDLDLLVKPNDRFKAQDVLINTGYVLDSHETALVDSSNRQVSFRMGENEIPVELHWGALHKMFSFQLDVGQLFATAHVRHHGTISFLSPSTEDLLLYLCAHATKHCWTDLSWLCDIASFVQANPGLDWQLCIRRAETTRCQLVLGHSLLLAEDVLGLNLPEEVQQYARRDGKAQRLSMAASNFLFAKPKTDPGSFQAFRYHLAFATCRRDRAWLIFIRWFAPGQQDWRLVRLPHLLRPFYYLVRPIRVAIEQLLGISLASRRIPWVSSPRRRTPRRD